MKIFLKHLKTYVIRGLIASIPLILSFFVLKFFYIFIDQKVINLINKFTGFRIPGFGIILCVATLYLIGYLTRNVVGRHLFNVIETISGKIPIIGTTYQVGKQLASTLSLPEQQVFKQVVLVDYFKPGAWSIGFVTGTMVNKKNNESLLKVFIPTVPNPTSGLLVILKESQTINPQWSVEQAMKSVISGGIIGPKEIFL